MPELPEVETIVRGLAPQLLHRRIQSIDLTQPRVLLNDVSRAAGFTIAGVRRRGKFILMELRRDGRPAHLVVHLGMTGQLRLDGEAGPYTHAVFQLDRGLTLFYNDTRQFGRLEFGEGLPARIARLGPDPFDLEEAEFVRRLRGRHAMIKPLLLNQSFLSGLGNIYADEALYRARIHPRALASHLKPERAAALYRAILDVLTESIRDGGSSVSNYVGSDGRRGSFQLRHQVYRRTGRPCPMCGATIRRIVVGTRGTHFCPRCQRAPR